MLRTSGGLATENTSFSPTTGFASAIVTPTTPTPPAVPVPAAGWLFGSGLLALIGMAGRSNV